MPLNYNHLIQAALYQNIDDTVLRHFLHQEGFHLEKRKFKLFVFSRLLGKCYVEKEKKTFVFQPPIELWVASPLKRFVQELSSGILKKGILKIGKENLEVIQTDFVEPVLRTSRITVEMLSPLVVYSTITKNSRSYTYYYSPFEDRFSDLVKNNLRKKYEIVYGQPDDDLEFDIAPERVEPSDFKVVMFKDTVIKGWLGRFNLCGSPFLLELALNCGLGSKNSEGFGFCRMEERDVS